MDWVVNMLRSPEVLMGAVGAIAGLIALSARGVKAKFADEIDARLDKKFDAQSELYKARFEAVNTSIGALQEDMTDVKNDMRGVNDKLDKILSNGFFPH